MPKPNSKGSVTNHYGLPATAYAIHFQVPPHLTPETYISFLGEINFLNNYEI
jgi:hypothetical protein